MSATPRSLLTEQIAQRRTARLFRKDRSIAVYLHDGAVVAADGPDDGEAILRALLAAHHIDTGVAAHVRGAIANGEDWMAALVAGVDPAVLEPALTDRFRTNVARFFDGDGPVDVQSSSTSIPINLQMGTDIDDILDGGSLAPAPKSSAPVEVVRTSSLEDAVARRRTTPVAEPVDDEPGGPLPTIAAIAVGAMLLVALGAGAAVALGAFESDGVDPDELVGVWTGPVDGLPTSLRITSAVDGRLVGTLQIVDGTSKRVVPVEGTLDGRTATITGSGGIAFEVNAQGARLVGNCTARSGRPEACLLVKK